jgi:hypothetical protein
MPSTAEIPGHLVLLRKEIHNGTITSSILEVLKKVSTSQELNEFMN